MRQLDSDEARWMAERIAAHVVGTQLAPRGSLERIVGDRVRSKMMEEFELARFLKANEYK